MPILIGPSRKAFIRKLLKDEQSEDISADLPIVETGTQAAVAVAVLRGAHIVRVHDVANTQATIRILDAMRTAQGVTQVGAAVACAAIDDGDSIWSSQRLLTTD